MRKYRGLFGKALLALALFWLCVRWGGRVETMGELNVASTDPRIILDAGHGGEDGGAVSVSGVKESQINLQIVQKMEDMFAFLGVAPVLTREEDQSIHDEGAVTLREKKASDLKNRAILFQSFPGTTAVSIHQNTYPEEKYRGSQVFFAPTEGSQRLAEVVQQTIAATLQPDNTRQAKPIPKTVYLMNHIENRAILVECGFLTNPQEDQMLQTAEYQKKMSVVLCAALCAALG